MSVARWSVTRFSARDARAVWCLARLNIGFVQSYEHDARSPLVPVAGELNGVGGLEPTGMGRDDPSAPTASNDGMGTSADVVNCVDAGISSEGHS